MTIIQAIAFGLLGGALGTTAIHGWINSKRNKQADIIENQNSTLTQLASIQSTLALGEQEIAKQLTDTDLLGVSCSAENGWKTMVICCAERCSADCKRVKAMGPARKNAMKSATLKTPLSSSKDVNSMQWTLTNVWKSWRSANERLDGNMAG